MGDLPLHVQIVLHLKKQVLMRKRQHEEKTGRGLEDREYQRHVGRIAECGAVLELLEQLKRDGLNEIEDYEEAERSEREGPQRRTTGARRAQ
jgi:hypothetical protein